MVNILLVEDDIHINNINKQALTRAGYSVTIATTQAETYSLISTAYDLVILDIELPDGNGLSICKKIKEQFDIPILFLTAMGENSDIVKGLNVGGDDYITKPYDLSVLIARVNARLRTAQQKNGTFRFFGDLEIDNVSGIARYKDKDLLLTKRELLLLWLLVDRKGSQIDRDELYRKVWGFSVVNYNALRVLISRVKSKLLDAGCDIHIITKRQKGYTLYKE